MKAVYADNPDAGPGNGYLIFSGAAFPDGPWEAALQVPSSQEYLTGKKGRWLGDEIFIPLEGEAASDGSIRLRIGPNIVDSLGLREKYRVKLKGAGGGEPLVGRLTIDSITYSPVDSLDNTAKAAEAEDESPVAPKEEAPAAKAEAETARVVPDAPSPENAREETVDKPAPPIPPSEKSGKITLLATAIAILALVGAGVGGYFLYKKFAADEGTPVAETTPPPAKPAEPATPPKAKSPETSAPLPSEAPAIADQVNGFFAGTGYTPKKAMDLAQTLSPETPRDQDALYRLYNYAGEKGEPSSFIVYGACLDPSKPQWGSILKDAPAALEIYQRAKKANVAGADDAIANLLRWLEAAAAKGNREAAAQLRQIRK